MTDPPEGTEVAVDMADLVQVLTEEKAELSQQVAMLKAAVRKLKREAAGAAPRTNGEVKEVVACGPSS